MKQNTITDALASAIQGAFKENGFSESDFFQAWYEKEHSIMFLFKKNLSVTNIAHAELLALIQAYTRHPPGVPRDLQFMSSREFKDSLGQLVRSLCKKPDETAHSVRLIADLYARALSRVVIVDSFFTSAVVYMPKHYRLDTASVCGKSGYIHSAGTNIFTRNVGKVTKDEFYRELSTHVRSPKRKSGRVMFLPYAHEDFSLLDRDQESDLRNGLDDVKLHIEKCYLGAFKLVSVINEMRDEFSKTLFIPRPGEVPFGKGSDPRPRDVSRDSTIWLMQDRSVNGANIKIAGDDIFFICYEQQYSNGNPCHVFDENKPAWVAHTTLPHMLAGAMLNITKPYWPEKGGVNICDPFCGSGTVYFEARKFSRTKVYCSDDDQMSDLLISDNAHYLSAPPARVDETIRNLKKYAPSQRKRGAPRHFGIPAQSLQSLYALFTLANQYDEADKSAKEERLECVKTKIAKLSDEKRLIFYIALRTNRRYAAAFERGAAHWLAAFSKEVATILAQFTRLRELLCAPKSATRKVEEVHKGTFSSCCMVNTDKAFGGKQRRGCRYRTRDARQLEASRYDVIVTDPPYGINTAITSEKLARLYRDMMDKFVRSLRTNGQIVICLPDQTRTGQDIPYFVHKEVVIHQILSSAHEAGREVIHSNYSVPRLAALYRAPFYWESERSLRRAILHFRLRKR